jgi:hypothetical protein
MMEQVISSLMDAPQGLPSMCLPSRVFFMGAQCRSESSRDAHIASDKGQ